MHFCSKMLVKVFSAYAEVFPVCASAVGFISCFLRVRGGVSHCRGRVAFPYRFSPRTRRCF